ncbi:MAG: DUF4249 domain-containing protein [Bacteroidales bacterium]|nr:DUF4249 domain-containing protein [Bacteroidales bacterium]
MLKKIFYLLILIVFAISGCRKQIDIKLKDTYVRLVVDGLLTDEYKRHTIKLSKTSNYFKNEPQPMASGAVVTISDGTSTYALNETSEGIYQTDSLAGVVGKTYTLNIKYNGEDYSASSMLKYVAPMDSITFGIDPYFHEKATINLWALEPATQGDYYMWLYYINDTLKSDTLKRIMFTDDMMVNGNYIPNFPIYSFIPKTNDTVTLEMRSITKEYYDFVYAAFLEVYAGDPFFSGPRANVKGNIVNLTNRSKDVMGFFSTSAITRKTRVYK